MAQNVSRETIQQMIDVKSLLARIDLAALISQTHAIRKAGRDWVGLCPFHGDKTPSFNVVPHKRMYYCHGCGATGDAIRWVQEIHGLDFLAACTELGAEHSETLAPRKPRVPEPRRSPIINWGGQGRMQDKPAVVILDDFPGRAEVIRLEARNPCFNIVWYPEPYLSAERMYLAPIAKLHVNTWSRGLWELRRADDLMVLIERWRKMAA